MGKCDCLEVGCALRSTCRSRAHTTVSASINPESTIPSASPIPGRSPARQVASESAEFCESASLTCPPKAGHMLVHSATTARVPSRGATQRCAECALTHHGWLLRCARPRPRASPVRHPGRNSNEVERLYVFLVRLRVRNRRLTLPRPDGVTGVPRATDARLATRRARAGRRNIDMAVQIGINGFGRIGRLPPPNSKLDCV